MLSHHGARWTTNACTRWTARPVMVAPKLCAMTNLSDAALEVEGFGIASLKTALEQLGFQSHESFEFPGKHLLATWFSPPQRCYDKLPRIFVSELQLHKFSPELQRIVRSYTDSACSGPVASWSALLTDALPWEAPQAADYHRLMEESEYAAWTLVNGYALNHTALSVHHMGKAATDLEGFANMLIAAGFPMNTSGGLIKVSPDGNLLQCSTLADARPFTFPDGKVEDVAGAYMEFVWRKPLPEFAHLPQATEWQRRDGFEAGNADKIFESTTLAAAGRGGRWLPAGRR